MTRGLACYCYCCSRGIREHRSQCRHQQRHTSRTAAQHRPSTTEIDVSSIPFYRADLSKYVLFFDGFVAAVSRVAAREKHRRLALLSPNASDAMSDEASLRAIQDALADADLRCRFDRDRFACTYRGMHADAVGSET